LGGRRAEDGHIRDLREIRDARIAGNAHDGFAPGGYRVDDSPEAAPDEVGEDLPSDAVRVGGDAYERDSLGLEDSVERFYGHRHSSETPIFL
jgi:hypothetical protein